MQDDLQMEYDRIPGSCVNMQCYFFKMCGRNWELLRGVQGLED